MSMSDSFAEVLLAALSLPDEDRAMLAEHLRDMSLCLLTSFNQTLI
jgi:hypothetical protein